MALTASTPNASGRYHGLPEHLVIGVASALGPMDEETPLTRCSGLLVWSVFRSFLSCMSPT